MQIQQLHNEVRKLRRDLEVSYEAREDLQDELKEMTQLYLNTKQERDKYKQHMELVRRDADNIERIVRENVERAVRLKDKQIHDINSRFKEQLDKISQLEAHKECYANTIKSLEIQLNEVKLQLEAEQEKTSKLTEQLIRGGVSSNASSDDPYSVSEEKRRLKKLIRDDEFYLKKVNNADDLVFGAGISPRHRVIDNEYDTGRPQEEFDHLEQTRVDDRCNENKENIQTTEFEDSADESTNVRLREENSQQCMMFEFGNNRNGNIMAKSYAGGSLNSAVKLGQVHLDVKKSAQFDGQTVRPGSSESSGSVGARGIAGSAKKTSYISGIINSAKKAASRVTPYQK